MFDYPETRASLILRLKHDCDQAAWDEFVEIYRPVFYRTARRKGLQDADAEDLAQQVLASVAAAVPGWDPDVSRGRFRGWLHRIAENRIINMLTRRPCDRAVGGELTEALLAGHRSLAGRICCDVESVLTPSLAGLKDALLKVLDPEDVKRRENFNPSAHRHAWGIAAAGNDAAGLVAHRSGIHSTDSVPRGRRDHLLQPGSSHAETSDQGF